MPEVGVRNKPGAGHKLFKKCVGPFIDLFIFKAINGVKFKDGKVCFIIKPLPVIIAFIY